LHAFCIRIRAFFAAGSSKMNFSAGFLDGTRFAMNVGETDLKIHFEICFSRKRKKLK
jgi:hypothetical protein